MKASISIVTFTSAPMMPARYAKTSLAIPTRNFPGEPVFQRRFSFGDPLVLAGLHFREMLRNDVGDGVFERAGLQAGGEPVAMVSPPLGALREVERVSEGQCRTAALANRRRIENGIENLLHSGGLRTFSRTARFLASA
jgi:hypothetical protein